MAWPIRHLPVFQNWDCHGCTNCCREFIVHVSQEERERITSQGWETDAKLAGLSLFGRGGPWWARRYHLNQHSDGRCIFLSDEGRCRIHEKFGSAAKPLACRLYPFILVPGGDHWRIGLRYACPSAARNAGRPLAAHRNEIEEYGALLERLAKLEDRQIPPPALQGRQHVAWPDLLVFVEAVLSLFRNRQDRVERRWRKCLALSSLCRQARFDAVRGERLVEFLNVLKQEIDAEVPADAALIEPPSWVGRILFRQILALYARQDRGPERGPDAGRRSALLKAAWRFATGHGVVPRLHTLVPHTTFERLEAPAGPLPEAAEQALERYYLVKIGSLQFCGPHNFGLSFWDGLEALALTLPGILWLSRAFTNLPREEAVALATRIVDNNFAFNPLFGSHRQRLALALLRFRGELEKLIAWYSR